jgi:hypothetical protein
MNCDGKEVAVGAVEDEVGAAKLNWKAIWVVAKARKTAIARRPFGDCVPMIRVPPLGDLS